VRLSVDEPQVDLPLTGGCISSPAKVTASGSFEAPPSQQVSDSLVRMLNGDSWFVETHFGTDPNKIVTSEYWNWCLEESYWRLRVPDITTLQLQDISKPGFERFAGGEHTSRDLSEVIRMIMHLALARRERSRFPDIFGEIGTWEDISTCGILLFRDQARVSMGFGRIKEKNISLFEKCLVFSRQKGHEQVVVHRVLLSDLLQVRYRPESPKKGSGILTIYWKEGPPSNGQKIFGARIFFSDLGLLKVWAAFLAINASTGPPRGLHHPNSTHRWSSALPFLPPITGVRNWLALPPAIRSGLLSEGFESAASPEPITSTSLLRLISEFQEWSFQHF
jgi:hypothetical protein